MSAKAAKAAKAATGRPDLRTLGTEIAKIFDHHQRGCDHEQDIASEIEHEVTRLLERFGLLGLREDTPAEGLQRCGYCASRDVILTHTKWCIEATP